MSREPVGTTAHRRALIMASAITALGGLLFGYDTGVVSGALLFLQDSFGKLSSFDKELVTSLLLVGAATGALGAGRLADRVGRRPTILVTALVFIAGVLGAAFAPAFWFLVCMRFVIGLAVGSASMTVPLFIGELSPPRYRGAFVSFNQLAITSGILVSYLVDYGLSSSQNWRLMFGLAAIPAALLFVGTLFQPESPHWLIATGREDEGRTVLQRFRSDEEIDAEVADVHRISRDERRAPLLGDPTLRAVLVLGVTLAVLQQVTGINTVIYYAPTLLHGAGLGSGASLLANVVNGGVNVGMTIVAIWLLDRAGRRPLLLTGTAGMVVGMLVVALSFTTGGSNLHGAYALMAVAGLLIYTGSFAIGLGPVFWLLIAEIYPQQVRGPAMSIATLANWAANFVVTISFLTLLDAIGGQGVFFLFAFLSLVGLAYMVKRVPETKDLSLAEIQVEVEHGRAAGALGSATASTTAKSTTTAPTGTAATTGTTATTGNAG
ncbi:MAG: sugar porter family MFS transporter [Acidobacteriota bacterium]|nr:sugar porter family MFS transporter [Acidobacteriota bacterium]